MLKAMVAAALLGAAGIVLMMADASSAPLSTGTANTQISAGLKT